MSNRKSHPFLHGKAASRLVVRLTTHPSSATYVFVAKEWYSQAEEVTWAAVRFVTRVPGFYEVTAALGTVQTIADDNRARLRNVADGSQLRRFEGHAGWVNAVAVSPNNRLLVTASADRSVRLWDLATGDPLRLYLGHEAPVDAVAFVPNRPEAVSGGDDRTIRVWPLPGGTHQRD